MLKLLRFAHMFICVLFHGYRCFELYSARNRLRADRKREGGGRGDTDIWKQGETELKNSTYLLTLAVDAPRGRRQWPQASRIRRPRGSGVRGSWGDAYSSELPLWGILVVLRPGGGGCEVATVCSAEAQSAAARSLGVAWGRFRAQPGAAGDTYFRHIGS